MPRKPRKVIKSRKKPHAASTFAKAAVDKKALRGKSSSALKLRKDKSEERVMVVSRSDMFSLGIWHGLKTDDVNKYINIISRKHKFISRSLAEDDPHWQQIIPYLIFENSGKYFVMQRRGDHSDKRLANKFSIGVGGHINERDIKGIRGYKGGKVDNLVMQWAEREFREEVDYSGKFKANFLGLINDDSNDVGLVHIGLVIHISGDSNNISIKDEHKSGALEILVKVGSHYKHMETWSQIVYDFLKERRSKTYSSSKRSASRRSSPQGRIINMTKPNDIIGILPDWVIAEYVAKNKIHISPLDNKWRENIDQVSIDFHLGNKLKLFRAGTYRFVDTKRGLPDDAMEEVNLQDGDPFILEPGAFAIATTREVLKLPNDILGRLEGKSSLARLGILVHSTAARFDPGWSGAPVLELGNLGPKPAILYCGMPICAFTFEKLSSPVRMRYEGSRSDRYSGSRIPLASRIEKHNPSISHSTLREESLGSDSKSSGRGRKKNS
ncbi:MAG: Deoxycytidine triphosphate deaminase [Candidatus Curtissbacteria bacterium GW2011_GWA1_41_11]|uniref:Deoxycytidine triphosphate deaminase n=1 Tax=Candidatus Curtissbacteria bacterium GW2011_GWA1_41_11 TaxID=1618409 RepID=A0A0G0WTZ9_9BACT|nr:MAG: Deoxycytidine triphosphate deaminase [Candidatus Curtissbacteria bacterium GW2011_GWA1_41_11]